MGKFINTTYLDSVDSVVDTMKDLLKNPYYKWMDGKPTKITYYHLNTKKSTLDPGSELTWEEIGSNSSLVYDKIENVLAYGIGQISLTTSREDFGLQVDNIEGEFTLLPNTIDPPYPVDYFSIDYLSEKALFRINNVSYDTLDNGANMYNLSYKLESAEPSDMDNLQNQVADHYKMLVDNNGSGFKTIIRSEVYDLVEILDNFLITIKRYYKALFYSNRVQTFTYKYCGVNYYDPYMVEFIKNNDLMEGDGEYIYICHQCPPPMTFPISYNRSFFHAIEMKDLKRIDRYKYQGTGKLITEINTTFYNRIENYFRLDYDMNVPQIATVVPCFKQELIEAIKRGILFQDPEMRIFNIVIKYFNNIEIAQEDIIVFEEIDYCCQNETIFYAIPCVIYCIESFIKDMLIDKEKANNSK